MFRSSPGAAVVSSAASLWPRSAWSSAGSPSTAAAASGAAAARVAGCPAPTSQELSGLEELLAPRREASAGILRLRALLLCAVHAILKPHPAEAELAEILQTQQAVLAAEGVVAHSDPSAIFRGAAGDVHAAAFGLPAGPGLPASGADDPAGELPPPWRFALVKADDLFWRCTFLACDLAHRTLQTNAGGHTEMLDGRTPRRKRESSLAVHGPESDVSDAQLMELMAPSGAAAWAALERSLVVLRLHIRDCARAVLEDCPFSSQDAVGLGVGAGSSAAALVANGGTVVFSAVGEASADPEPPASTGSGKPSRGDPFRLGGYGLQTLSSFLRGPLLVLLPVCAFVCDRLFKPLGLPANCGPLKAAEVTRRMAEPPPGGPAADPCRAAMTDLAAELRAVLGDLAQALAEAKSEAFDHLGSASGSGATADAAPATAKLAGLRHGPFSEPELEKMRRTVTNSIVASHRRQLGSLESVVRSFERQLQGLNTRSSC
eukprot:TRINITY_DN19470_c0_g5_i1.p1 TRINITY_DN19470_c0_g5~~TRINITY_DN19470_c0_g5_i1.p1  ORF type:complete len:538 (-),score=114.13 TRINITY_DN19470_c0_g5_i1:72-1541(-)